jgi:hypothetical protein
MLTKQAYVEILEVMLGCMQGVTKQRISLGVCLLHANQPIHVQ